MEEINKTTKRWAESRKMGKKIDRKMDRERESTGD